MRKHVGFAAMAICIATSAHAADLDIVPNIEPFSWTGLYLGPQVGYGWGKKDWSLNARGTAFDADASFDIDGWLGGGQIGYNYQIGNLVLGVEGDFSFANIDGSQFATPAAGSDGQFGASVDWTATAVGKIGFAADRFLFYAKGGAAWARDEFTFSSPDFSPASTSDTVSGWVVGAGVEWAFARNWSLRAEYNYMDFGTRHDIDFGGLQSIPVPPPPPPPPPEDPHWDVDQHIHSLKFALNYRFN